MMGTRVSVIALALSSIIAAGKGRLAAETLAFTPVGTIPGPADLIRVDGGRAYVAAGRTLTIFDVSNPGAPERAGSHTFPEKIWGFRVVGSLVYVAADFFGVGVLDVSNVSSPVLRGSLKMPGQAKSVAIYGTKALVADHMSGLDYLDVSDASHPVKLGSFFLDGYARDVVAIGSLAYAIDAPTGLYVLDLAKADPLEPVSTTQSASAPGFIEVSDASASPRFACLIGAGSLQIYDVTDPARPLKLTTFRTPGRPQRAALKGKLAYVADGPAGLQVVDLSMPPTPTIAGGYQTAAPARDVAVADSLIFVVVGTREAGGEVVVLREANQ